MNPTYSLPPKARTYLRELSLYQAGVKIGERAPKINLAANENPYGAAPEVMRAMGNLLQTYQADLFSRYPAQQSVELRQKIAEIYDLDYQNIICGNGSDEVINALIQAYASIGDEILHAEYGFSYYPIAIRKNGATPIALKETDFRLDTKTILAGITDKTKIIMLANPNNPTGFFIKDAELAELHAQIPSHIILMIDAAYAEYVTLDENDNTPYEGALALARKAKNIVVTRTFSKIHGLAGLRIGWAYGHGEIINNMIKLAEPFNLNILAQKLALVSLEQKDYLQNCALKNTKLRAWLRAELEKLSIRALPSAGNFLLCAFADDNQARMVFEQLKSAGILVRHTGSMGLARYLRITIGKREELDALLQTLRSNLK